MDLAGLSPELTSVVSRVIAARPPCAAHLAIEDSGDGRIARLRSPTGDRASDIVLWHDAPGNAGLGVGFRSWHAHPDGAHCTRAADDEVSSFVAIVIAIIDDELVGLCDPASRSEQFEPLVDLCDPTAVVEELTHPSSSGRASIRTWSGKGDREISLSDLGG